MTVPQSTAILVVGMHRSGTSALTGVLGKLGITLGDRLLEPAGDNPRGYWEHEDVVAVHERLLHGLGSHWGDIRALPSNWLESEPARLAAAAIGDIISRDFSGKAIWSVKDPRICRFLPLWLDVLAKQRMRAVVLFMGRNPDEVAASIQARNRWRPLVGKLLWLRYMTEAVASSRDEKRGVILYDDLLADPIRTVTHSLALLGVSAYEHVSEKEREAVAGFIDISGRHHSNPISGQPPTTFDSIAEKVYDALVSVAHESAPWTTVERAAAAFDQEWKATGACIDAVGDMAAGLDADARAAKAENFRIKSELEGQVRWSEEALLRYETLQAESAELSSKLSAQVRWSEEAQLRYEKVQAESAELSSKLNAQVRWSEEAQVRYETLQAESAELSSKLNAQVRWSEEAQVRYETLQAESAELSSKLNAQIRWSEEAQLRYDKLQAESAELSSKLNSEVR